MNKKHESLADLPYNFQSTTRLSGGVFQKRSETDKKRIQEAERFALLAHRGEKRKSGEPYLTHPVGIVNLLHSDALKETEGRNMSTDDIIVALLHDVLEHSPDLAETLYQQFGYRTFFQVLLLCQPHPELYKKWKEIRGKQKNHDELEDGIPLFQLWKNTFQVEQRGYLAPTDELTLNTRVIVYGYFEGRQTPENEIYDDRSLLGTMKMLREDYSGARNEVQIQLISPNPISKEQAKEEYQKLWRRYVLVLQTLMLPKNLARIRGADRIYNISDTDFLKDPSLDAHERQVRRSSLIRYNRAHRFLFEEYRLSKMDILLLQQLKKLETLLIVLEESEQEKERG